MADYATPTEIGAFAEEAGTSSSAAWNLIATSASRLFDRLTEVPDDFYEAYDGSAAASARTFYGDGTAYLRIDPHISTPTPVVAIPGGEYTVDADDLTVQGDRIVFLARTRRIDPAYYPWGDRFVGWRDAIPVTVTAKWGFAEIPKEVKYATIQIAITLWRQRDPAVAVTAGIDGVITLNLPRTAQMIVDKYRGLYSRRVSFA